MDTREKKKMWSWLWERGQPSEDSVSEQGSFLGEIFCNLDYLGGTAYLTSTLVWQPRGEICRVMLISRRWGWGGGWMDGKEGRKECLIDESMPNMWEPCRSHRSLMIN